MTYQQTRLSDTSAIGAPGPLPAVIGTWTDPSVLADLTGRADPQFGFDGMGFWPVTVTTPSFDATVRTIAGTITLGAADPKAHVWTATADLRDLTAAELAANLAAAQVAKTAALTAACSDQIVGGYSSAALGSAHTYPSKPTDQTNMLGSVTASLLPNLPADWTTPFWVADGTGTWSFAQHTAAQIQRAGLDGKAAVASAQLKLASLSAQVAAAKTASDVAAVVW